MESWARVLECCVDEAGRIDFAGLSAQPADLERYVAYLARFDAAALPSAEARLAHAINAYNAMAMYAVIRAGIPRTNAGLRKIRFFYLRRYSIDGVRQSLYAYEKRIREVGDPRVHFALNCMSVSCPRLPRQPFSAETLDAELEREARRFFAESRNLALDHTARRVRVSSILAFYTDEFVARAGSLVGYINRYAPEPVPLDYAVEFIPYDWTINRVER